jgi:tRNA threonylcarbamoyladenosine biosynthesis protein TsaB
MERSDQGIVLAIDTSTRVSSIALYRTNLLAEHTWRTQDDHTKELLPAVDWLLKQQHSDVSALTGVVVATGPGSFNGVRVGVSTAKALALSLQIPIVGIGTLEASAHQYIGSDLPIRPVLNAGRGQLNTALFNGDTASWHCVEEPESLDLAELVKRITSPVLLCGEIESSWVAELQHHLGNMVHFPPVAGWVRRAGYLAELGSQRIRQGQVDDVVALQPLYLRKPAITQSKRQARIEECR